MDDVYYSVGDSEQLQRVSFLPQPLPQAGFYEARFVMRKATGETVEFNPRNGQMPGLSMWTYRSGRLKELSFDPKKWYWPCEGCLQKVNFFGYSCKRGYRIILKKQFKQLGFDCWMGLSGYNFTQRRDFFSKLWHIWILRKVSSMVLLTIAEGLPIGEWRQRCIGLSGVCLLCRIGVI